MKTEERLIKIPLEEYKELLITKGRYEELVKPFITTNSPNIVPLRENTPTHDIYEVSCGNIEINRYGDRIMKNNIRQVMLHNIFVIGCFALLSVYFNKWWIILLSLLFYKVREK